MPLRAKPSQAPARGPARPCQVTGQSGGGPSASTCVLWSCPPPRDQPTVTRKEDAMEPFPVWRSQGQPSLQQGSSRSHSQGTPGGVDTVVPLAPERQAGMAFPLGLQPGHCPHSSRDPCVLRGGCPPWGGSTWNSLGLSIRPSHGGHTTLLPTSSAGQCLHLRPACFLFEKIAAILVVWSGVEWWSSLAFP